MSSQTESNPIHQANTDRYSPVSFLETRQAWLDGKLSMDELLLIPRVPQIIGQVPSPQEFSQPEREDYFYTNPYPIRDLLSFGKTASAIDERFIKACMPSMRLIFDHAASLGINTRSPEFDVSFYALRSDEYVEQQAHLDLPAEGKRTLASYLITDKHPTAFLLGSFIMPKGLAYSSEDEPTITQCLEAQRPEAQLWRAQPYDIVAFDSSMPHAAPDMQGDQSLRTFLRVWFESKA